MSSLSIQFIQNPSFSVDFNQFFKQEVSAEKLSIQEVAYQALRLMGLLFLAVKEGTFITLGQSWVSFKHIVLGYYGSIKHMEPPSNIYLVVFKIVYWVLALGWCLITTSCLLFLKKINENQNDAFLSSYNDQINMQHIRTKEILLDASHVPATVTVDQLANIFEEINFKQPEKPGYMAETSRREDKATYTVEELNLSLAVFIKQVKERTPFLGTPLAFDTPRLMAFYQQIENAVRLSIFKMQQDMEKFTLANGNDPAVYEGEVLREYKNLLETKSRIALDLAIAGKWCGARYMGNAMKVYEDLYPEHVQNEGTLSDCLIELLAKKRKKIAQSQIHTHLGSSTHAFTNYLGSLGEILGLPGTKNVIEHLSDPLDQDFYLTKFFDEYTVDTIIDTVQKRVKKSHEFREKIIDWMKEQLGGWKKHEYLQEALQKIEEIRKIMNEKIEISENPHITHFKALVLHLKEKNIELPERGIKDFWDEFFALEAVRTWTPTVFGNDLRIRMGHVHALKSFLKSQKSVDIEGFIFEDKPLDLSLQETLTLKKEKIAQILNLEQETIERILENKTDLVAAVKDKQELNRKLEFIQHFKLETIATMGISQELMEWLLVSQNILHPQLT